MTATFEGSAAASHPNTSPTAAKKVRDIRLDFFRGLCLFIIFVAHSYGNPWASWIPARFGFSDATEIFVFCSGMASALAFAPAFARHGWVIGLGRVTYRIWQVYWAHISMMVLCIAMTIQHDRWITGGSGDYLRGLKFENLFNGNAQDAFLHLVTLHWVPPYFDILPMYMIILCMLPAFIWLAQWNFPAAAAASVAIWFMAQLDWLNMPSAAWSDASWFFNPFGWQLVFFTGFAFMKGWLPAPAYDRRLAAVCIAVLLFSLPLEWEPALRAFEPFSQLRNQLWPVIDKGEEGLFRVLHFFALAYLAYHAAGENGANLRHPAIAPIVNVVAKVGTQSLGVFMTGIVLSFNVGPLFNVLGGANWVTTPLVNGAGFACMIAVAYIVAWYKSQPWRARSKTASSSRDTAAGLRTGTGAAAQPAAGE